MVERARSGGQLPGLVAVGDDGRVSGWCYASLQDGLLFIGALHGDRAETVRALLDAVLASPEASYARGYRCFIFPETPAVAAALTRRRFDVQPFMYLRRIIAPRGAAAPAGVRLWTSEDVPETARLLARAYAGSTDGRCFAPGGRLEEWAGYLAQLVRTPACGTWDGSCSLALVGDTEEPSVVAVLIATSLSPETTHIAQLAVDPLCRGRGLARTLVEASAARAATAGAVAQTLLVAQSNEAARTLYAGLGFEQCSYFLYAERARISRVASNATWPSDPSAETA
jgi:ribosomal protein S18 acetylase RimI-like enzyme